MDDRSFRIARWVYSAVLAAAAVAFLVHGVNPPSMPDGGEAVFQSTTWTGFVVSLGFLMIPWWPRAAHA